jgi:hypothetical protein
MRRFFTHAFRLGIKELWSLWRDPMMLVFVVYTTAQSMPEALHKAPIAIVDEDASPLSARIASSFYPPSFTTPVMLSLPEVDAGMDAGVYTFALVIPAGFQRTCGRVAPAGTLQPGLAGHLVWLGHEPHQQRDHGLHFADRCSVDP